MQCSTISTGRAQLYSNTFNDAEHCHGNPTQHIIQSPFTYTNNYDGLTMFQDIKDLNQQRKKMTVHNLIGFSPSRLKWIGFSRPVWSLSGIIFLPAFLRESILKGKRQMHHEGQKREAIQALMFMPSKAQQLEANRKRSLCFAISKHYSGEAESHTIIQKTLPEIQLSKWNLPLYGKAMLTPCDSRT